MPTPGTATSGGRRRLAVTHVEPDTPMPTNDERLFSIPPRGRYNTFQRDLIVTHERPADERLVRVRVDLLDESATVVGVVLDDAADGVHITPLSETQFAARVTFSPGTRPSFIDTDPPPFDRFGYRVTVTGERDGTVEAADPKDVTGLIALWKAPGGVARYSAESTGGSDWCRRSTYHWIDANRHLLTPIDGISREHGGQFRPHDRHRHGHDIDLFHPAPPLGAGSGARNYWELHRLARAAIVGDAEAAARLAEWVHGTRVWLDTIVGDDRIATIGYARGAADPISTPVGLCAGWARELLLTGRCRSMPAGNTIELGLRPWATRRSTKLFFDDEHNSQVHIRLAEV